MRSKQIYVRRQTYTYTGVNIMWLRQFCLVRNSSPLITNFTSSQTLGYEGASFQYYFNIYSSNIDVFDIFLVCNIH
jgi:hypothetical protein